MFETNDLGKSFAMVRNPNWDQATDPNRKPPAGPDRGRAQRQLRRHRQPAAVR
jgi:peptide/nickel transport system substrate-binding protein